VVSGLARVFLTLNNNGDSRRNLNIPMINSITNSLSTYLSSYNQVTKKKSLMNWFKSIPELTALARKVAKNIVGGYHFETIAPNESGRNKILKANKFATEVSFERQLFSQVMDMLITGEGFGWLGKIKDEQLKEEIAKIFGLGLIQQIQAMIQYHKVFGNLGIAMLQVAKTLLCRPQASIATVFGANIVF
jgi:hypothetical protein